MRWIRRSQIGCCPHRGGYGVGYLRVKTETRQATAVRRPLDSPGLNWPMVISPASASPRPCGALRAAKAVRATGKATDEATIGDGPRWRLRSNSRRFGTAGIEFIERTAVARGADYRKAATEERITDPPGERDCGMRSGIYA